MITDLTKDPPEKVLWKFALPMVISIIFQQMYNVCDSIIAGQFIDDNALSAVSASYQITMIFMSFANGSNAGCAVVISQYFGAKKFAKMKNAVSTALISSVVFSVIITIIGLIICNPLLKALETPENIFADSSAYLAIYIAGFSFLFIYNICTGIFTALGDSKTPLYFLIASSVGNVVLNIVFVTAFGMGVPGIAWATFIAQGISCVLSVITLFRRLRGMKLNHHIPVFTWKALKTISLIAVPSIIQSCFVSVGGLFIQKIINRMGYATIAGFGSAIKLNTFAVNCIGVIATATSSFTAQNIGANKPERVTQGYKAAMKLELLFCIPFVILYFFFPGFFVGLFSKEKTPEVLAVGSQFIQYCCPLYAVLSVKLISDSVLRGGGAMRAFMFTTFSDLLLRVVLAYILTPFLGFTGISLAWPIGWIISSAISYVLYKKGYWKSQALT